jgi:hypothetical protein
MSFQKTVIVIAGVLLALCLLGVGLSLRQAGLNPSDPMPTDCPDYWLVEQNDEGNQVCVNQKGLGTCKSPSDDGPLVIDFNSSYPDNCSKYTWATNCHVAWDGITYGVSNPCVDDSSSSS